MDVNSLSIQIKKRRQKLGLTLSNLARRVNTSAATLSRYENGWQRFELYTLQKIATALNCKLSVNLEPATCKRTPKNISGFLNKIQRLFWDYKLNRSDLECYPIWIMERILEYGSLEDIRQMIHLTGREEFLKNAALCRFQSARTAALWKTLINREGISCTKRSFQRGAWIS